MLFSWGRDGARWDGEEGDGGMAFAGQRRVLEGQGPNGGGPGETGNGLGGFSNGLRATATLVARGGVLVLQAPSMGGKLVGLGGGLCMCFSCSGLGGCGCGCGGYGPGTPAVSRSRGKKRKLPPKYHFVCVWGCMHRHARALWCVLFQTGSGGATQPSVNVA